jgi:hypothetical protein
MFIINEQMWFIKSQVSVKNIQDPLTAYKAVEEI